MPHAHASPSVTAVASSASSSLVGCTAALPHCEGAAPNEAARSPAIERDRKRRGTIETHYKLNRTLAGHAHEWHTSSSTRAQRAVTLLGAGENFVLN